MSVPYAEVIGDPIAQSKSPAIHGFWLEKLGLSGRYDHCLVKLEGLGDYLDARRPDPDWRGCNVTMPHKLAIVPLLDRLDPLAASIGAVNTVVREADGTLTGYNTDAPGFLEPLRAELDKAHLFRMARVLGTGGAARAIVAALARENFVIVLAGRDPGKARAMLDELAPGTDHHAVNILHFGDPTEFAFDDREGCLDLIVNASPLGMTGQPPLAFDFSHAPPGSVVYDIVTSPLDTAFLQAARAAGFATVDGLSMLIGQADIAFARFFGERPPREHDEALRALILS
ncbi:shikimate dehydrogenase family protein [Novosphingobium mangrovi (ex Huang et al. 2023)]|uniref:Shikimate dehydrogenase (NADP(+)) n=1 Tax=Novosphingobium mangrovi (ex Huang et al. 2023) TaxID=2976432 RepID=A0ABT2I936_9SPHN|nr:shikimate dehydrogenase [Novosphingobium mangrovi (ex Huang et al. 2023)]MCT2401299.1 shikimate dehydrogenase [Novosphingobium mangrovi (ex Huang et al. 2023)]